MFVSGRFSLGVSLFWAVKERFCSVFSSLRRMILSDVVSEGSKS